MASNGSGRFLAAMVFLCITGTQALAVQSVAADGFWAEGAGFDEDFDETVPPTLPSGWRATHEGSGTGWVTTTVFPTNPPNAAGTDTPGTPTESMLIGPAFYVPVRAGLFFAEDFNLELTFDGAVLEIAIGDDDIRNERYADIIDAGGTFRTTEYNSTISPFHGSTLAGRQAWSGTRSGHASVTVALPARAVGQNARFRWRVATDDSVPSAGYAIDNVHLFFDDPDFIYVDGFDRRGIP
jgi:hypothetical protein